MERRTMALLRMAVSQSGADRVQRRVQNKKTNIPTPVVSQQEVFNVIATAM
jgi:hypothetical protein